MTINYKRGIEQLRYHGTTTGRFSSKKSNPSTLPRDKVTLNRSASEQIIMTVYPGLDGIGADTRIIGAPPSLEAPYSTIKKNPCLEIDVLSADILKTEDVIYNSGGMRHRAKILRFDQQAESAEIEFTQPGLIPPTMWVPLDHIEAAWGGRVVNTQTHCPRCDVSWKETPGFRFSFFDCPQCGAKKEDHAS